MTLQDLVDLTVMKSPLICGGLVIGQDVANFAWALSLENDGTTEGRRAWELGLPDLNKLHADLLEYLAFIFLDAPKTSDGEGPAVSQIACAIDFLFTEYSFTSEAQALATPLPRLFQYQRAATLRKGGKPSASAVNIARAAWLRELNAVAPEHRERWKSEQVRQLEKERKKYGRIRH